MPNSLIGLYLWLKSYIVYIKIALLVKTAVLFLSISLFIEDVPSPEKILIVLRWSFHYTFYPFFCCFWYYLTTHLTWLIFPYVLKIHCPAISTKIIINFLCKSAELFLFFSPAYLFPIPLTTPLFYPALHLHCCTPLCYSVALLRLATPLVYLAMLLRHPSLPHTLPVAINVSCFTPVMYYLLTAPHTVYQPPHQSPQTGRHLMGGR